jgi:multiple sugar transport system ATP-binding protein
MRAEIARIQRDLKVTTIYVTHDQSEALTLGDRVCVLRHGVLQQVDRPHVLYNRPANLFVAGFIGSPAMNLVAATLAERGGVLSVTFGPHELEVPASLAGNLRGYAGRDVALGIRPEDLSGLADGEVPTGRRLDISVDILEDMGSEVFLHFAVDAPPVAADALKEVLGSEALAAAEVQTHHHGNPFVARVPRGTTVRESDNVRLVVETERMHFFDLVTGIAI